MKATELRIGNLVHDIIEGLDRNVQAINENGLLKFKVKGCENSIMADWCHTAFRPIPLTEEWLTRLGFEIKKGAWGTSAEIRIGRVRYVLYQNRNVWSINPTDGFRVDFKYIHTVQNHYFALTNSELTLND